MATPAASRGGRRSVWRTLLLVLLLLLLGGGVWAWRYGRPLADAMRAYIYGFPIVVMELTKEAATSVPTAGEITAPVDQFAVMTKYPDASFRAIPRTGLDTLFATAWADLDAEPLVLSVPDTGGRYYVIALFDMWSNVFASIGKRTTGTGAATFLIADATVNEATGTMTFTVTLSNPIDTGVTVVVNYSGGTATGGGTDYDSTPGQVVFSANSTTSISGSSLSRSSASLPFSASMTVMLFSISTLDREKMLRMSSSTISTFFPSSIASLSRAERIIRFFSGSIPLSTRCRKSVTSFSSRSGLLAPLMMMLSA